MPLKQLFFDIAADAIRSELLEPRGIDAPFVPVNVGATTAANAAGQTYYSRDATKVPIMIAISGNIEDPIYAASTLAHEMVHTALPFAVDHDYPFDEIVRDLGLKGPAKATVPGPKFERWFYSSLLPKLTAAMGEPTPYSALPAPWPELHG